MIHGQRRPLVAFTTAAAVTLIGTFVPWLRSGSTSRSSYDLLSLMSRLDFASDGLVSTLVRWWPIVPLLITIAVVAAWWRQVHLAVAAAVASIAYAGGVGTAVIVATRDTSIDVGIGPWVCAIGSVGLLASAAWLTVTTARGSGPRAPAAAQPADRS